MAQKRSRQGGSAKGWVSINAIVSVCYEDVPGFGKEYAFIYIKGLVALIIGSDGS